MKDIAKWGDFFKVYRSLFYTLDKGQNSAYR